MITVKNLSKDYRVVIRDAGLKGMLKSYIHPQVRIVHAVHDINMHIGEGELVGYIGPNGSGKSTTIKMLSGILEPTGGSVEVAGIVPSKNRIENAKNIGVVFGQRTQLWWDLPVMETYELLKKVYAIPKETYQHNVEEFIEILDLKDILQKPVRQLSLGQRMRAEFAAALLHNPRILYLDEPTIGLDVTAKHNIREFIRKIHTDRKITVILTSHDTQDIEILSERLITIRQGEIQFDGTVQELKDKYRNENMDSVIMEMFQDEKA